MKRFISVAAAVVIILGLSSCGESENGFITLAEYNRLQEGMSYEEVKDLIDGECELSSNKDINKVQTSIYVCTGEKEKGTATLRFENNKLVSFNQINLK